MMVTINTHRQTLGAGAQSADAQPNGSTLSAVRTLYVKSVSGI